MICLTSARGRLLNVSIAINRPILLCILCIFICLFFISISASVLVYCIFLYVCIFFLSLLPFWWIKMYINKSEFCNLRPPDVAPIVLGFNHELSNEPGYKFNSSARIFPQLLMVKFAMRMRRNCYFGASGKKYWHGRWIPRAGRFRRNSWV